MTDVVEAIEATRRESVRGGGVAPVGRISAERRRRHRGGGDRRRVRQAERRAVQPPGSNRLADDPKAPYLRQLLLRLNYNDFSSPPRESKSAGRRRTSARRRASKHRRIRGERRVFSNASDGVFSNASSIAAPSTVGERSVPASLAAGGAPTASTRRGGWTFGASGAGAALAHLPTRVESPRVKRTLDCRMNSIGDASSSTRYSGVASFGRFAHRPAPRPFSRNPRERPPAPRGTLARNDRSARPRRRIRRTPPRPRPRTVRTADATRRNRRDVRGGSQAASEAASRRPLKRRPRISRLEHHVQDAPP